MLETKLTTLELIKGYQNGHKEYLDLINERSVAIRHELAQRTRHQLRTVPTLTFFLDDSLDYIENIDNLLK